MLTRLIVANLMGLLSALSFAMGRADNASKPMIAPNQSTYSGLLGYKIQSAIGCWNKTAINQNNIVENNNEEKAVLNTLFDWSSERFKNLK
jgi:hypothetical protein